MALYKFGQNDIFHNRIKTHPSVEFHIYDSVVYYNNHSLEPGAFVACVPNSQPGELSLYEMNVDRVSGSTTQPDIVYAFIEKGNDLASFKTVSANDFAQNYSYGDTVMKNYPLTASMHRACFTASAPRPRITSLKNTMNYYAPLSNHYSFSSSMGDKESQAVSLISIPSIFYGSSIKKGTVSLKFYVSGTLQAELQDKNRNGELIQVTGTSYATTNGDGLVAGVVLYDEGFVLLTGSWNINEDELDYLNSPSSKKRGTWFDFGVGANEGDQDAGSKTSMLPSASFSLSLSGTNYVPTMTMLAHAPKGELNYSGNPTYISYDSSVGQYTSSIEYREVSTNTIKNTVSSSYSTPDPTFEKQVFITKVGIYDENKNLIGIASTASPVRKKENQDYTFKLKLDF